jgi:hypothetical protein
MVANHLAIILVGKTSCYVKSDSEIIESRKHSYCKFSGSFALMTMKKQGQRLTMKQIGESGYPGRGVRKRISSLGNIAVSSVILP